MGHRVMDRTGFRDVLFAFTLAPRAPIRRPNFAKPSRTVKRGAYVGLSARGLWDAMSESAMTAGRTATCRSDTEPICSIHVSTQNHQIKTVLSIQIGNGDLVPTGSSERFHPHPDGRVRKRSERRSVVAGEW